ncbi:MAG: oligosaccharide flippase family protein [Prolixibacteraceae bacterium]|nr:oligosaccharide flippase family protein [Prolixibacteraceae bacterium]
MKKINFTGVNALQLFQLIRYGTLFLIGILLSKSGIGQTAIGQYEMFVLIAGAFTFFWVNGFFKVLMPVWAEKKKEERPVLLFNIFILLSFFALLAALLVFLLQDAVSQLLLNGSEVPLPGVLALYILFNSPALMVEYIYLLKNRSSRIIIYALTTFSLQLLVVGVPPFLGYGLEQILYGLLGVSVLRYLWLLLILKQNATARVDVAYLNEYIKYGYPLVLATLLSSSARYIDGFIITSQFSPREFAVFQYGARELPLALLLSNSLSMAMLSRFSKKDIASPLAEFRSEVYRLHWALFPISIVLMLTSHWLFPALFNTNFAESATIFNIYLLLVFSRLLFPQTIITAKKMNRYIVQASFFEIVINVTLSLILSKTMGIAGVAYATVVAYTFEKIYLLFILKKKLAITLNDILPIKIFTIMSLLLLMSFVISEFILR